MLKQDSKHYWLKISSIFNLSIFFGLLLTVAIINNTSLNNAFSIYPATSDWKVYSLKIFLIILLAISLLAGSLWTAVSFRQDWILKIKDNYFISWLLAVLTLNFYGCFFIGRIYKHERNNGLLQEQFWPKWKTKLGIKSWQTVDYVLIAFFCALTLTLAYIEENLLPHLPFGGGVAIKYIPLIIVSYATSFFGGWLTGFVTALMSLLFIPASNIISPWSYLLDYFLPMTTPAIVALLPAKLNHERSVFTYINYFIHCFLVLLIIFFWQVLGGYFLWTTAFPESVWNGYSAVLYAFVYNFIHIFIFTYPIIQAIVPILYRSLGSYYLNRYH